MNSSIPDYFGGASNLSAGVDKAFIFIFAVAAFFIIGITAFMIYTVIRFNRKKGLEPRQFTGSTKLEIIWTVIPLIIVLIMFYIGWRGFAPMRKVPADAMKITAIGRMWKWDFDYGNGKIYDTLIIPVNKPIRLDLYSEDVNHSLFIPAFRVKEDVVPGYNNYLWFTPLYVGEYDILCTEYCGLLHSAMLTKTRVVTQQEFDTWLANLKVTEKASEHEGLAIMKANSCFGCHSMDGSKLVGPSFKSLFDSNKTIIVDGKETKAQITDEYLRTSITEPNKEIVKGYNKGLMQSYSSVIKEEDIQKIVDYLNTFDGNKQ